MMYNVAAYKVFNKMVYLQSNYTYAGNAPQCGFFYFSYFLFISPISSKIFLANMHSK